MDKKEFVTKELLEIDKELKTDETLILKVFKLEKFFNKYKKNLIGLLVLLFLLFVGYKVNNYLNEQNLIKSNEAFLTLQKNPTNKEAFEILKGNRPLFELYLLHTSDNDVKKLEALHPMNSSVKSIIEYKIAVLKGDIKSLENYTLKTNSLLRNPALFNLERLYLENGDYKKAEATFENIEKNSQYKQYGKALLHYGIVK